MGNNVTRLIPVVLNLKHMDQFPSESRIGHLFGKRFDPAVRALVAKMEDLSNRNLIGRLIALPRLCGARKELDFRRKELLQAVRRYLESLSVGRAQIAVPPDVGPTKPGYQAIGEWLAALPAAVFPEVSEADLAKLGLPVSVRTAGRMAYGRLMGTTPDESAKELSHNITSMPQGGTSFVRPEDQNETARIEEEKETTRIKEIYERWTN
jgi:hypothetical protein